MFIKPKVNLVLTEQKVIVEVNVVVSCLLYFTKNADAISASKSESYQIVCGQFSLIPSMCGHHGSG